jgi:hypothetical protein
MSAGCIYLMVNPAWPEFVKVGQTTRDPQQRAKELSATGVPYPYMVIHVEDVENCELAEREMHERLNEFRVVGNREFFRISVAEAIDILRSVAPKYSKAQSQSGVQESRNRYNRDWGDYMRRTKGR